MIVTCVPIDTKKYFGIGLCNNVEDFAEGFRYEAFQDTAGARIKADELPRRRIFGEWVHAKLAEDPLFIEQLCSATKLIFGSMGT